ncbi:MAG: propanediol/glycerol family dehydratase large subunit, partial [Bacillota bacterium]|nr:propanediol/glycerol family dehydratase large subunit [Bacillota bacterium]
MKRQKRVEELEKRPVHLDGFVDEWPEEGLIAMESPNDPKPSVRVENGKIVEMDGKTEAEFDLIDQFIAKHAVVAKDAEKVMAMDSLEIANKLVDPNV